MEALSFLEACKNVYPTIYEDVRVDIDIPFLNKQPLLESLQKFYSQPFTPTLITELFDGWKHINDIKLANIDIGKIYFSDGNKIVVREHDIEYNIKEHYNPIYYLLPNSLDEFIVNCKNVGIKLFWKENSDEEE